MASYGDTSGSTDAVMLLSSYLLVGSTLLVAFLSAVWFLSTFHFDHVVPSIVGDIDGRDGKQTKILDIGGGSRPTDACDVHQSQRSGQASEFPSSSSHPTGTACGNDMLEQYGGSLQNEHRFRSLEVDGVKHKIFLSHSGKQKDFVEQLCVDLERGGCIAPFFDQRDHSLPKGKDFVPLIKEAAQHCHVAVMVLSEEFLCSKWPMIELAEFYGAQQAGNQRLNMLPLFYKLSAEDLSEKAIEERWLPVWRELAKDDERINVTKWSDAVRALRKANGLVFGKKGLSEVGYRKDIVRSIFKLSPPELLYGSSRSMVGYNRICKTVSDQFVRGRRGGPSFLCLYGASGAGKTTLTKALCDHYCGEYMGRVCHVDLGETFGMSRACPVDLNESSRLRRVKRMLESLCGFDEYVLNQITDFAQGLTIMRLHMKWEPVFLAIDNITKDSSSWNEARGYLMAGFHPESRIVITSQSRSNIGGLVPMPIGDHIQLCVPMPRLSVMEAGELFLRSAAPSMSIIRLTAEERRIVGLCIQQCLFSEVDTEAGLLMEGDVNSGRSYHPMALLALGDYFRRYYSNDGLLLWRGHLEENPLLNIWEERTGMGGIIWLQFNSLLPSEQHLFLDIATFNNRFLVGDDGIFKWLCKVYNETEASMERRLQDVDRSGMIIYKKFYGYRGDPYIRAHEIYRRFAEWYVTNHGVKRLKNTWCVFKIPGSSPNQNYVASDLVRLKMFDRTRTSARLLTSMMRELDNLEVLQLHECPYLSELNLEGLESLRHLELVKLQNLVTVTLTGSLDTVESGGIFDSLLYVVLWNLDSLVHGPDVRLCTSLHMYYVYTCPRMTNFNEMLCPHLKVLELHLLERDQFKRLPNVTALHALERLRFIFWSCPDLCDVEAARGVRLRDLGKPYLRVVEELCLYLRTEWDRDDNILGRNAYMSICWGKEDFHPEFLQWISSSGGGFTWK